MKKMFILGMVFTVSAQFAVAAGVAAKPVAEISVAQKRTEEYLVGVKKQAVTKGSPTEQVKHIKSALDQMPELNKISTGEKENLSLSLLNDNDGSAMRLVSSMIEAQRKAEVSKDAGLAASVEITPALIKMKRGSEVGVAVKSSKVLLDKANSASDLVELKAAVAKNAEVQGDVLSVFSKESRESYNNVNSKVKKASEANDRLLPEESLYLGIMEQIKLEQPNLTGKDLHDAVMQRVRELIACGK